MRDEKIWKKFISNFRNTIQIHLKEHKTIQANLLKYTKRGQYILEVGSGSGIDSAFLSSKGRKVFAIDKSLYACKTTKMTCRFFHTDVKLLLADTHFLPFKDNVFDLIFSSGVLHYFKDIKIVINEQKRVLKRKGYIIINVPYTYSFHTIYKKIMYLIKKWPWGWETQYSKKELRDLLKTVGFKIIDTYSWGVDYLSKRLSKKTKIKILRKLLMRIIKKFPVNIGIIGKKI